MAVFSRFAAFIALAFGLVSAGCSSLPPPPGVALQPMPQRAFNVMGVAIASVLHAYSDEGKPGVEPVSPVAMKSGTVTWLGHSSFLVASGRTVVMTDPIFSPRMGLVLSPERYVPPPDMRAITRLDAVILSHVDHDHLDVPSLKVLAARFPDAVLVMPRDSGMQARRLGFSAIREIGAGERTTIGQLEVTATSSNHFGQRDLIGLHNSEALGFALRGPGQNLFFAGDTAYGDNFREIRRRFGRFDAAIVPIGAWKPPDVFNNMHATPEQAMQIARDLGAHAAIAGHWGTFGLGPDTPLESKQKFRASASAATRPVILDVGQSWRGKGQTGGVPVAAR